MKIAFFDTHSFEIKFFKEQNKDLNHEITFFEPRLTLQTVDLAYGFECVCAFVNDKLNADVLENLSANGTKLIALRSAGFNHVDLEAAHKLNMTVVRVPEYSPYSVAEHAVTLILALNRKIHRAYNRVREGNFSLDGLVGFDLHGKTVGIIGTGKIGAVLAKIMTGFGCQVLAFDMKRSQDLETLGVHYVSMDEILRQSDILSLHVPLNPGTRHLIDTEALSKMKPGVILINTGRGALVDTSALIQFLKTGHVGGAGLDVYEEEEAVFFKNLSDQVLQDDLLARLLSFPNVLLTSHQAFLTNEALTAIAKTTLNNISDFEQRRTLSNEVSAPSHVSRS